MKRVLAEREMTSEGPVARPAGKKARSATVTLAESPLTWLHSRGHISNRQFDAGERLRADWERAQLAPSITTRWGQVRVSGGGGDLTPSERQMAARTRFHGAVDHAGPDLSDVLWRVVCAGDALPLAEKALGWPVRSGKLVLRIALDRLADYYRIG